MNCKNIECSNETKGKRVYCSMSCRNVYVNKYMRNYDKVSNHYKKIKDSKEKEYLLNPKECKECNSIIEYDKKRNDFCGKSCSTSYTNKKREVTWGDNIKKGIYKYLIENNIKKEGEIGFKLMICSNCELEFKKFGGGSKKYCSEECIIESRRKHMSEYIKYKRDALFNFSMKSYPDEYDFSLIEEHGWYSPTNKNDNLNGVSRDHILSMREGFELGIDPKILAHPANCQLMIHNDNISKHKKSDLTLEELLEKIKIFENKYGKYETE